MTYFKEVILILSAISIHFVTGCSGGLHSPLNGSTPNTAAGGVCSVNSAKTTEFLMNQSLTQENKVLLKTTVLFADVLPIFKNRCQNCHGNGSLPNWTNYATASKFAKNGTLERRVVTERSMPMAGSSEASQMTDAERNQIAAWIQGGALNSDADAVSGGGSGGGTNCTSPGDSSSTNPGSSTTEPDPTPTLPEPYKAISSCVGCHGQNRTQLSGVPTLAGMNAEYLKRQLISFQDDRRLDMTLKQMNAIAKSLSQEQIEQVIAIYSSIVPAQNQTTITSPSSQIQAIIPVCALCHLRVGNNNPTQDKYPHIAGQNKVYLSNQLKAFRDYKRTDYLASGTMPSMMENLDDAYIDELAEYLSQLNHSK